MAEKKQCAVCNKEFTPCSRCLGKSNNGELLQWRRVVCCPEHFSFHLPIINYVRKNIDKETAKKELQTAIKYYGEVEFNDNVKRVIDEIMAEPVAETVDESVVVDEVENEDGARDNESADTAEDTVDFHFTPKSAKYKKKK